MMPSIKNWVASNVIDVLGWFFDLLKECLHWIESALDEVEGEWSEELRRWDN
jgi:hypothetical protein